MPYPFAERQYKHPEIARPRNYHQSYEPVPFDSIPNMQPRDMQPWEMHDRRNMYDYQ